jgi:hypothetical protein
MDATFLEKVWGLFVSNPGAVFSIIGAIGVAITFAWWLRGFIGTERIATLEERLRLAADNQKIVTNEVEKLRGYVAELTHQIEMKAPLPALATSTALVTGTIRELTTANTVLGSTLTPTSGLAVMTGFPAELLVTRNSDE